MFEVAEHVEPLHLLKMLVHIREELLQENATFWLSTPNWNRKDTAANHVNEMEYRFLGSLLEYCGYEVKNTYGTFASMYDYIGQMSHEEKVLFDRLREYYDSNVLSIIFAPLFPEHSRNALWEIKPTEDADARGFPLLHQWFETERTEENKPGSTSLESWAEFDDYIHSS